MTPEKFLNGGSMKVVSASDFVGSGGFKVVTNEKPGLVQNVKEAFKKRTLKAAASQVTTQKPASKVIQTVGQGAAFVGDVAIEGAKAITPDAVGEQVERGVRKVVQTKPVQNATRAYEEWKTAHPEAAANLEGVVNIASILPAGAAGGAAAKVAVKGTAKAAKAGGGALGATGRATKAAGEKLYDTGFNKTVGEAERQLAYEAKVPFLTRTRNAINGTVDPARPRLAADTAFERGIKGTEKMIGVQAKRQADALWSTKIAPAVKSSKAVMTKDELLAPAEKLVAETTDPTRRNALKNALDALKEDYKGSSSWTLETAQKLKRDIDKFTPTKMFRGQDVASEMRTLQHAMADGIRRFTYNALDNVNIKKDYLDWANLHQLEQIGVKAISEAKLKGGFGSFWSGMWDMTTTPIKTIGGRTLYRVGGALEFVGDKGIKKFGEYLNAKGFQQAPSARAVYEASGLDDQRGFAKLPQKAVNDIHPDDLHLMETFIDHARIGGQLSDSEFSQVEKLAQHFGISMDKGLVGVAKDFERVLDGGIKVKRTTVPFRDQLGRYKRANSGVTR